MSTTKLDPMRALESLTPGGSEFVGDPERCVAAVRSTRESQHRVIIQLTERARKAEAELTRIRGLVEREKLANLIYQHIYPYPGGGPNLNSYELADKLREHLFPGGTV